MSLAIEFIRAEVKANNYELSIHANNERINDDMEFAELEKALLNGEIIEDYSDDRRGESCLVLGYTSPKRPLHMVYGKTKQDNLLLITLYIPQMPKWRDPKTRNR